MNLIEFLEILDIKYVYILLLIILLNIIIFRRNFYNLFDPLLLFVVFFSFWTTTSIFLYYKNVISLIPFSQYLFSIVFFIMGFKIFNNRDYVNKIEFSHTNIERLFSILAVSIYIILTIFLYFEIGIPLLSSQSRIGFFSELGEFKRLKDAFMIVVLYFISKKIIANKLSCLNILLLIFLIIDLFFEGGKSGFLNILFSIGIVSFMYNKKINNKIIIKYIMFFFGVFLLLNLLLNLSFIDMIKEYYIGFILRGDMVFIFYPNFEYFSRIINISFFSRIFRETFGLFGFENLLTSPNITNIIMRKVYGYSYSGGPNDIFPVLSYLSFGYVGSLIYSFILGSLVSFIRYYLLNFINKKWILQLIIFYIILKSNTLMISINNFSASFVLFVILSLFLYSLSYIIYKGVK